MLRTLGWWGMVAMLLTPGVSAAQQSAQAIIERAIQAHGGREALMQQRVETVRSRGRLNIDRGTVELETETTTAFPDRLRSVARIRQGDRRNTIVQLYDGSEVRIFVDDRPVQVGPEQREQILQTIRLEQMLRLVPLLTDPAYQLGAPKAETIRGVPVTAIEVRVENQQTVTLSFEPRTGYLCKVERWLAGAEGKQVKEEIFLGGHRTINGRVRVGRFGTMRDGKSVSLIELVDVKARPAVDPEWFRRP